MLAMNTTKKGQVRTIVFKEGDTWYGVALEFNIVVEGEDRNGVYLDLQEAIKGYVESQAKVKGSRVAPLNQKPDVEYQKLWDTLASNKPVPSPISVSQFGFVNLAV